MVLKKIKTYGELVMFSHTLFSLPFAMIGMLWAGNGLPSLHTFTWILIALVSGRNGANALNRWVDKNIDSKNPRTTMRHIPAGVVKSYEALAIAIICFIIFGFAAYKLNPLCFKLMPVALLLFIVYSYTKRFTWACHLILGIACAGAPVGAWLAVTGAFSITPFILGAVVMFWVSGFDIIYGTQDIEFDRQNNLYSIPAIFGLDKALMIAKLFHGIMIFLLLLLYYIRNMSWIYMMGILISAVLLSVEHQIVTPSNKKKMNIASYHLNQIISPLILICVVLEQLLIRR